MFISSKNLRDIWLRISSLEHECKRLERRLTQRESEMSSVFADILDYLDLEYVEQESPVLKEKKKSQPLKGSGIEVSREEQE